MFPLTGLLWPLHSLSHTHRQQLRFVWQEKGSPLSIPKVLTYSSQPALIARQMPLIRQEIHYQSVRFGAEEGSALRVSEANPVQEARRLSAETRARPVSSWAEKEAKPINSELLAVRLSPPTVTKTNISVFHPNPRVKTSTNVNTATREGVPSSEGLGSNSVCRAPPGVTSAAKH